MLLASAVLAATPNEETWRAQVVEALQLTDALPALAAETHGEFEVEPGIFAERISYATLHGMRVPAILYLPRNRDRQVPSLIVVNGHGGDKYSWYASYTAVLYARAGAAVLTFDPLGEGERHPQRKSGSRAHDTLAASTEFGLHVASQLITDVRQAANYLAQRPEIDAQRIAAVGYSLGSFLLALAGAVEPRIHACVLTGGGNLDEVDGYWDRSKPLCQGRPYQALRRLDDRGAVIFALHAARGPTFVFNGDEDEVVSIPTMREPFFRDLRQRTIALRHGKTQNVFEYGFESGASHRPYFVTRPVALWLERTLDIPNWTEDGIHAMPTSHIGTWSTQRGVELDRGYATEHREAGTRALGEDVPALTRDQLSVFGAEEWEEKKPLLTIDHWERRVLVLVHHQPGESIR